MFAEVFGNPVIYLHDGGYTLFFLGGAGIPLEFANRLAKGGKGSRHVIRVLFRRSFHKTRYVRIKIRNRLPNLVDFSRG
ncbi:MAG: hypothetical protein LIP28_10985, partial [Deltaproteobacteria bacterium]|nr:hypothetical protein [Deltaproteobacteria bacterium]